MPLGLMILVAAIQGLTEFLPVSSSGHLVLIPIITDFTYQGRMIDVAAHVGSLIAIIFYLRSEIIAIACALLHFGRTDRVNACLGILLVISTIPIIIVGFVVNYSNLSWIHMVQTLAIANIGFAILLWLSDRAPIKKQGLDMITWSPALLIGIAQICALIPGASRSGVTMSAARLLGFDRITAARFSLLLSIPTIAGAGLLKSHDLLESGNSAFGSDIILVVLLSAGFAWLAITWMMRWLATASFGIFVYYRILLGTFLLFGLAQGWLDPQFS